MEANVRMVPRRPGRKTAMVAGAAVALAAVGVSIGLANEGAPSAPRPDRASVTATTSRAQTAYAQAIKTLPAWKKDRLLTPSALSGTTKATAPTPRTATPCGKPVCQTTGIITDPRYLAPTWPGGTFEVATLYAGTYDGRRVIVYAGGVPASASQGTAGPVRTGAIWVRVPATGQTHEYLAATTQLLEITSVSAGVVNLEGTGGASLSFSLSADAFGPT